MANNISKSLQNIRVNVTSYEVRGGVQSNPKTASMAMADKLNEYIAKLGYTNASIYNIALRLLVKGKVRLEFRPYIERLALADPADKMYRMEALAVINKFLAGIRTQDEDTGDADITQKIIVH